MSPADQDHEGEQQDGNEWFIHRVECPNCGQVSRADSRVACFRCGAEMDVVERIGEVWD